MQVSYDVMTLYTSVPADKAINVLIDTFNNDKGHLKEYKKIKLTDINKVTELSLSVVSYTKIIFACFRTVDLLDFH